MILRASLPLDMIWVLIDLTNSPRAESVLATAEAKHQERLPGVLLSVNRNIAGTRALVKLATTEAVLRGLLSASLEAAILQVYTEADHAQALALVTAEAWTGPQIET